MHGEMVQHRIACLNQVEEKMKTKNKTKKTREGVGMRKQGMGMRENR